MASAADRGIGRQIGLFIVAAVLIDGLAHAPGTLTATFHLALFVHIGFSIHDGRFGGWRTATWLLLIGAWVVAEAAAFVGFILPWGQVQFWLAGALAGLPLVGEALSGAFQVASQMDLAPLRPALLVGLLLLDLAVMHAAAWRRRPLLPLAIVLAAAATALLALPPLLAVLAPAPSAEPAIDGLALLPAWHSLPLYALLRAVPDKTLGVALTAAAMLAPLAAPWMRGDLLRAGRLWWAWALACAALGAIWIGLGVLGAMPPEGAWIAASRVLAAAYALVFLAVPAILHRAGRGAVA